MPARSIPILLVDDLPDLRKLERWYLEEAGYQVDEVANGATALARLRSSPQALIVVMNTRIPIVNARDLLQVVACDACLQRHGFVLVTALAHNLPGDLWELTRLLDVSVVAKPFMVQELLAGVAAAAHHSVPTTRRPPPD
jgi:two-component system OmpR family response regulator